jgi:hypothetical protein
VVCAGCGDDVVVRDGMVSLARCACGSRSFRWDDHALGFEARVTSRVLRQAA